MLYNEDCIQVMKTMKNESIDMIFADPPYFLSNGGKSISNGKVVSVNKGEWDKKENYKDVNLFTENWLNECFRLLKKNGTIWVTGTYHNIFDVKNIMDKIGFKIVNVIIWKKTDPPPLIYKNKFRFSYEYILWADKGRGHLFNYEDMFNLAKEEMEDVWILSAVTINEKRYGYHPTQKPEHLLERIILAASKPGDTVMDPFLGSGTSGYVATKLKRHFIGIEKEKKYFDCAVKRIGSLF